MFFNACKTTVNLINVSLCNYKGKSLLFENWSRSGLHFVSDIVDDNGLKPLEWFL